MTSIDPWFLYQLKEINDMQLELEKHPMESIPTEVLREAKRMGFSDGRLAGTWRLNGKGDAGKSSPPAQEARHQAGLQARGYLRRGIRELHAVSLLDLRRRRRGHADRRRRKSSSWAAGPTASGRELNSITAAATRRSRCATMVTRPSWSTAILRRSRPTTTPAIASTSSR